MDEIKELQKKIDNLTIKAKGINLEYQYVNNLKNERILKLQRELEKECSERDNLKKINYKVLRTAYCGK